jgi:hypothetical protein
LRNGNRNVCPINSSDAILKKREESWVCTNFPVCTDSSSWLNKFVSEGWNYFENSLNVAMNGLSAMLEFIL